MDRMDDFIKRRLADQTPSEDGWNVPSDDLWNNAKVHFPKKKKRRIPFWVLFLMGTMLLSGIGSMGYFIGKNNADIEITPRVITNSNNTEKLNSENHKFKVEEKILNSEEIVTPPLKDKEDKLVSAKNDKPLSTIQSRDFSSKELAEGSKETKGESKTVISKISKEPSKSYIGTDHQTSSYFSSDFSSDVENNGSSIQSEFDKLTFVKSPNSQINRAYTVEDDPQSNLFGEKSIHRLNQEIRSNIDNGFFQETKKEKTVSLEIEKLKSLTSSFALNDLDLEEGQNKTLVSQIPGMNIPKSKFPRPRVKEIGISYSETLLRLVDIFDLKDSESGDEVALDMKYFNTNLHYTSWLSKRFSYSTGLYFTNFDLDLKLSVFETVGEENIQQSITSEVKNVIQSRYLPAPSSEEELEIMLQSGVVLAEGDTVNIKANLIQKGKQFQLPLFFNYHVAKKRWEGIFSLGASLNIININDFDGVFDLYKDGIKISESSSLPNYEGLIVSGSLYTKANVRYHINSQFNIGLGLKIDFTDVIFSGLNAGLFYRF